MLITHPSHNAFGVHLATYRRGEVRRYVAKCSDFQQVRGLIAARHQAVTGPSISGLWRDLHQRREPADEDHAVLQHRSSCSLDPDGFQAGDGGVRGDGEGAEMRTCPDSSVVRSHLKVAS